MSAKAWTRTKLSNVVSLQRGHDLPEPERTAGDVPVMGSFGITGWHNVVKCKGPGVTVGRSGASFGVVAYTDRDYWPLNTALYVTDFHGNDERFVYYLLKTIDFTAYNTGSAQPSLNRNHLVNIQIALPSVKEQRAIVRLLGSLDDKVQQNDLTCQALEALARATFKAWFVDFGPVKARAAGATSYPGMPAAIYAAFPSSLNDSPIGSVPEGWNIRRLDSVLTLHYGKSLPRTTRKEGEVPVYGSGGLTGTHSEALVNGPGIIVGRKGSVGTLFWEDNAFFPIDTTYYVEPAAEFGLHYLFELLRIFRLETMNTDAAVPGLNRENAYRLESAFPPAVIAASFEGYANSLRDMISQLSAESAKLAALRDYLLPRLLDGRVRAQGDPND